MAETTPFRTRDIGYGIEYGWVELPARSEPDWTGKREYRTTTDETVYLFDDEILTAFRRYGGSRTA